MTQIDKWPYALVRFMWGRSPRYCDPGFYCRSPVGIFHAPGVLFREWGLVGGEGLCGRGQQEYGEEESHDVTSEHRHFWQARAMTQSTGIIWKRRKARIESWNWGMMQSTGIIWKRRKVWIERWNWGMTQSTGIVWKRRKVWIERWNWAMTQSTGIVWKKGKPELKV